MSNRRGDMAQLSRKSPVWAASRSASIESEAKRQKTGGDDPNGLELQRALRRIAAVPMSQLQRTLGAACDTQEVQRVAGDACVVATDPTAIWVETGDAGMRRFAGSSGKEAALSWLGVGSTVRGWIIGTSESSALVRVVALQSRSTPKSEDAGPSRLRGRDYIVRGRLPLSQVMDGDIGHRDLLGLPVVAEVTQLSDGRWDCELSLLRREGHAMGMLAEVDISQGEEFSHRVIAKCLPELLLREARQFSPASWESRLCNLWGCQGLPTFQSCARAKHGTSRKWSDVQSEAWADRRVREGVRFAKAGDHLTAMKYYDTAMELWPDHKDALVARGAALANDGKFTAAIASFDRALRIDPTDANASKYREVTVRRLRKVQEEERRLAGTVKRDRKSVV